VPTTRIIPRLTLSSAEHLAARFPPLLLAAERIAASVAAGVHGRRRAGRGEHFWQYRPHQPGDAATVIDWRASARSPRLLVREREWEAAQTALLWLDASSSFNWSSSPKLPLKSEAGRLLLLALAALLLRGGERVGICGSTRPPVSGRAVLARLHHQLLSLPETGSALPPLAPFPRHAKLVLFGDFLDPVPDIATRLKPLFASGLSGHLVQILDPAEENLPWQGRVTFTGLENEGRFLAPRTEKLRKAYQEKLAAHQAELRAFLSRMNWTLTRHRTDKRPEQALLALYQTLAQPC
jgi:uncharacterized protein (DUF58 family)